MRRLPSWLVVGAVGLLLALAAADAIRPHREAASTEAKRGPADLQGVLVLAGPDCSLAALRLPALGEVNPPQRLDCGGVVWSDDGSLAAQCTETNGTEVRTDNLEFTARVRGCAPAWRPDGALSVIDDGDLLLWRRHGRPQLFLSAAALADEIEREIGGAYKLAEVAWIEPQTFAAIVRGSEPWQQAVIVASRDGIELLVREFGQRISNLSVGPAGSFAFARARLGREFVAVTRGGREVPLPRIANARAIAWSPDGRWVAIATRTSTSIAAVGTRRIVLRAPVGGNALDWQT